MPLTTTLVIAPIFLDQSGAAFRSDQGLRDTDRARRIFHVDNGPFVVWFDLHRRMCRRGGCATDQQRQAEFETLHLGRDVDHFVERRRDKPGQTNHFRFLAAGGFEDFFATHHHAQIDDFEIVALKNNADDILAYVMNVAFDGRHDDFSVTAHLAVFFFFNERNEMGNGLFHDSCRFHNLRQKHFPVAKQVAYDIHTRHQRALDYVEWPL